MIPESGKVYTLAEIEELELRDSPFLQLTLVIPGSKEGYLGQYPIQTSHCTAEDLLKIPGWANSRWRFVLETREYIPVFLCRDEELVRSLVDVEVSNDDNQGYWITPKAYSRKQYKETVDETYLGIVRIPVRNKRNRWHSRYTSRN